MQLDHERLDVYDLALEFLVLANGIIEGLPRGRSHLADQFTRASLSIVLNLAEGAGKHSRLELAQSCEDSRLNGKPLALSAPRKVGSPLRAQLGAARAGPARATNLGLPNKRGPTIPYGPSGTGTGTFTGTRERSPFRDSP